MYDPKLYQLTHADFPFAVKVAKRINEKFPVKPVAFVIRNCCFITANYWNKCQDYVKANCNIKGGKK